MSFLVMKFGGTSVASVERIRNVATPCQARGRRRQRRSGGRLGHGRRDQPARRLGARGLAPARCARVRRHRRHRRAGYGRAAGHRPAVHGHPGPLLAGLADSHHHQQRSWRGAHQGHSRRQDPRPPGAGRGGGDHRLPGHRARAQPHLHARPRRLRHQRRRHRRRRQGRSLRHLHRRRRRLHHRPAHRAESPPACQGLLRGDAGDGLARLQGAADAFRRACHATQDACACAVQFCRAAHPAACAAGNLGRDRHHHLQRG